MITIQKSIFSRLRNRQKFSSRPYKCIFIERDKYFIQDELKAAFFNLGVKVVSLNIKFNNTRSEVIESLVDLIIQFEPDFVFTLSHHGIDEDGIVVNLLEDIKIPLVSWMLDSPDIILKIFDKIISDNVYIFSCDLDSINFIKNLKYRNVEYLPLATSLSLFNNLSLSKENFSGTNVAFVGENFCSDIAHNIRQYHDSKELLVFYKKLAKRLVLSPARDVSRLFSSSELSVEKVYFSLPLVKRLNFDLSVFYEANKQLRAQSLKKLFAYNPLIVGPSSWKSILRDCKKWVWHNYIYYNTDLKKLYKQSKIIFNTTSVHMNKAINQRIFDVPAAGGFVLTDYSPQLECLFDISKEVAVYHDINEIEYLTGKFLKDKVLRNKISTNAFRRISDNHTYEHRIAKILQILKNNL